MSHRRYLLLSQYVKSLILVVLRHGKLSKQTQILDKNEETLHRADLPVLKKISIVSQVFFCFLSVLGLRSCAQAFFRGYSLVEVFRLLTFVASLVAEHGL